LISLQGTGAAGLPLTHIRYDYRRLGRATAAANAPHRYRSHPCAVPAHQKLYASRARRDFIREQRPGFGTRWMRRRWQINRQTLRVSPLCREAMEHGLSGFGMTEISERPGSLLAAAWPTVFGRPCFGEPAQRRA
jgi:hypothetical protein